MDELKPSEDLRKRCSDILEWRQTGSLPFGAALRAFAEQPRFDRHESDRLRAAEDATLHEAATLIAKWNTRAASGGLNEQFGVNEQSGISGQLASLEQRAEDLLEAARSGWFDASDPVPHGAAIRAITAALANQQGVEKDAERYRWLKAGGYEHADDGLPYIVVHRQDDWGKWHDQVIEDDEADAAVDAAMSTQPAGDVGREGGDGR